MRIEKKQRAIEVDREFSGVPEKQILPKRRLTSAA
jgi:hypothetical protein